MEASFFGFTETLFSRTNLLFLSVGLELHLGFEKEGIFFSNLMTPRSAVWTETEEMASACVCVRVCVCSENAGSSCVNAGICRKKKHTVSVTTAAKQDLQAHLISSALRCETVLFF